MVNGLKTAKDRADEAKKLLEFGYRGFESKRPVRRRAGRRLCQAVRRRLGLGGAGRATAPIGVLMPKNSSDRVSAKIVYSGPVPAPVKQGQPIANLNVYRGDSVVAEIPLFAAESVERGNLPRRAFDARLRTGDRPLSHRAQEDITVTPGRPACAAIREADAGRDIGASRRRISLQRDPALRFRPNRDVRQAQ